MRLIDADALKKRFDEGSPALSIIDDTPTKIDAVVVVRCGDCIHYHPNDPYDELCHCDGSMAQPAADDYCSWGRGR